MFCDVEILMRGLELGEGPLWHAPTQTLRIVDITKKSIHAFNPKTGHIKTIKLQDPVGCIVSTKEGALLAAVKNKLVLIHSETGEQTVLSNLDLPDFIRFNDGKCGPDGRLWVGTMATDQTDPRAAGCGSLYCVENGEVMAEYKGFTIANGMAWSADGKIFYHIDTPTGKVDAYDIDANGALQNRRVAVSFEGADGSPDGMCIDAAGNLWVAMWGGGQVLCVNPADGSILHSLVMQDKNVTCCAFGGADLQTLYITTARDEKGRGGNLFAVHTQVTGTESFNYGGKS